MAIQNKLKKIEGVKSILYKDTAGKFGDEVKKKDFAKIKPPFELVIRVIVDGKRKHIAMPFKNRTFRVALTEAKAELERIRIEGFTETQKIPTYEKVMNDYLHSRRLAMSERNADNYRMMLKIHLQHIKDKRIDKIKPEHLQRAVNEILDKGGAPRTAKAVQDYSRPVFNYAIGKGYIDKNPANNLRIPKFDNRRYFEIDEESARRLYRAILEYENPQYRSIFIWLLHGRRLNEVLSLEWQHINLNAGTYEIVYQNNKARRNKQYPLTALQLEALPKPHGRFGLVWRGEKTGEKINREIVRRHWKRITDRAGIVGMRLHDLRHLFGYLAVNVLGLPLEAVAEVLGHTSTQITQRYANVGLKTVETATERFFKLLEGDK